MNNLIVYKEAIKFYNGGKTKGMKGVDLPVFTTLKAVKNPGISLIILLDNWKFFFCNHEVDQNC